MKKIIISILAALIVLSFYLLDKDIKEYGKIIVDQEIKISELELKVNAQKNVLLFQGARIRELEVQDFGFPVIAAVGLGYFVYYVWQWVTKDISPTIGESKRTLIGLIDKVRMLDNDMIRLNIKLKMILQQKEHKERLEREFEKKNEKLEKILNESK